MPINDDFYNSEGYNTTRGFIPANCSIVLGTEAVFDSEPMEDLPRLYEKVCPICRNTFYTPYKNKKYCESCRKNYIKENPFSLRFI